MILVTGGAGYIGSHFVLSALENGETVVILDNLVMGHEETVNTLKKYGELKFEKCDITDIEGIREVFKRNKGIDAVVHFAGLSLVGESVQNPQKYYYNNVFGTLNLLAVMLENNVNKIVFSSSAAVYGNPVYTPIDENHPKNPINPYGKTKLMIENILDDYDRAYGLKSVRLRYFNVAGADKEQRTGEWHNPETHLIPNILKADENHVFKINGDDYNTKDGTCIRDYINIEDLVEAHILALNYLKSGGETDCFNLATKEGNSVKDVFAICEKVKRVKIPSKVYPRREGDPEVLVADNKKAKDILGWVPKNDLEYSIRTANEWENVLKSVSK